MAVEEEEGEKTKERVKRRKKKWRRREGGGKTDFDASSWSCFGGAGFTEAERHTESRCVVSPCNWGGKIPSFLSLSLL